MRYVAISSVISLRLLAKSFSKTLTYKHRMSHLSYSKDRKMDRLHMKDTALIC